MVNKVGDQVPVDRQGRLVLPSRIREALGLKRGGQVVIRLDGSRAILEAGSKDSEKEVQEWASLALNSGAGAFTEEVKDSWKWMSREYARRKLGLS